MDHGIQVGGILFPRDDDPVNVYTTRTFTMTKTIVRAQPVLLMGETTVSDSVWSAIMATSTEQSRPHSPKT